MTQKTQTYGYCRVSSKDQKEDRQLVAMKEFGVQGDSIFLDKISGKDFQRPAYRRLIRKLKPNDTLVIKSIDRLGRDYSEILEQWRVITREKQAAIVVLDGYVKLILNKKLLQFCYNYLTIDNLCKHMTVKIPTDVSIIYIYGNIVKSVFSSILWLG